MLPNLDKLVQKCAALGLEVKPAGKKLGKEDCVRVLRQHFLPPGGLPYEEVTPMLCFAEWNLKPDEQRAIWQSTQWAAQRKLNGCRLIVHFVKGKGIYAHSRTVSLKTYRFQELTDQLLISKVKPTFSATVDCEVMIEKPIDTRSYTAKGEITKTSLHSTTAVLHLEAEMARKIQVEQDCPLMFHVFDIMSLDGKKITHLMLKDRLQNLELVKDLIMATPELAPYFVWPELVTIDKKGFAERIIAEGGEGVILKNLRAPYEDSSSRPRTGWVKVKKRIEFDAFVTGFKRGDADTAWKNMVGALEFSVYTKDGKTHVLGYGTNLTMEQRQKVTVYDKATDTVSLVPGVLGKVAEISGQDISARSLRLSHCTIDRWRPKDGPDGKRADECVVDLDDLEQRAEWVG